MTLPAEHLEHLLREHTQGDAAELLQRLPPADIERLEEIHRSYPEAASAAMLPAATVAMIAQMAARATAR